LQTERRKGGKLLHSGLLIGCLVTKARNNDLRVLGHKRLDLYTNGL
jgi:hypothetical protein